MPIISHRGAKGLDTENSLASISKAVKYPISYVEFDIQKTKDDKLVLIHDKKIGKKEIAQLQSSDLAGLPSLDEALEACKNTPALIELKSAGTALLCAKYVHKTNHAITSFLESEIEELKNQGINNKLFIMQRVHPFGIFAKAQRLKVDGVGINKNWLLLLPFLYSKAQKEQLDIYIYTLNSVHTAKLLQKLMPNLYICTDRPDKLTYNK